MQETWPLWEDSTCRGATQLMCHDYYTCAREPGGCNHEARGPQTRASQQGRATAMRRPRTTAREETPFATTREKPLQQQNPAHPQQRNNTCRGFYQGSSNTGKEDRSQNCYKFPPKCTDLTKYFLCLLRVTVLYVGEGRVLLIRDLLVDGRGRQQSSDQTK